MSGNGSSKSRSIHAHLGHPVIDSDGHWQPFEAIAFDFLRDIAGPKVADRFPSVGGRFGQHSWSKMTAQEKRDRRFAQPPWWGAPTRNTLDRATSMLPKLMYERLDDMGLDYVVLYPSGAPLYAPYLSDEELRRAGCHAFNAYVAETWRPYSDRITPVATIPMHTPQEAIEELEHAKSIGLKAAAFGSLIRRPIPAAGNDKAVRRYALWLDVLGIDSEYDYDPVWRKCEELGFAATFHSAAENMGLRNSLTNFVFNHIGHFGEAGNAVCKALFLGGVTRRFPRMRFGFLEGGVAWACSLYADLIGHWDKRNINALEDVNPANLDRKLLEDLFRKYGGEKLVARLAELEPQLTLPGTLPEQLDDFAACKIEKKSDIRELFVPSFYFGCESDDPTIAYAFAAKVNPFGAKLGAILSSDISHFDVIDMTRVLEEAWEPVEDKKLTEEDFRDFAFVNPVKLWTGVNRDFFKGTAIEKQVDDYAGIHRIDQTAAAS
jgi:predicted TIM-barrel fold metal-dependent hydrolase